MHAQADLRRRRASASTPSATAKADFGVSGGLAWQSYADSLELPDYWTWNAGVYWTWKEALTVDLRYSGSTLSRSECGALMSRGACGNRFMATLSVDTAVSSLISK